jgi:hypothetical protein
LIFFALPSTKELLQHDCVQGASGRKKPTGSDDAGDIDDNTPQGTIGSLNFAHPSAEDITLEKSSGERSQSLKASLENQIQLM